MANPLVYIGLLLCLAITCHSQAIFCRIPWGSVENTEFVAQWTPNRVCRSYRGMVFEGYSSREGTDLGVVGARSQRVTGLDRGTVYGFQLICVMAGGRRRTTSCRTKTFGIRSTLPPIMPRPDDVAVPIGSCGEGRFTCDDGECIPAGLYCNRQKECADGTDERNCPGSCPPLVLGNGNMTCSLFSSPGSACFFDCRTGWGRIGPRWRVCRGQPRGWNLQMPVCRVVILDIFADRNRRNPSRIEITMEVSRTVVAAELTSVINDETGEVLEPTDYPLRFTANPDDSELQIADVVLTGFPRRGFYIARIIPITNNGVRGAESEFPIG